MADDILEYLHYLKNVWLTSASEKFLLAFPFIWSSFDCYRAAARISHHFHSGLFNMIKFELTMKACFKDWCVLFKKITFIIHLTRMSLIILS